MNMSTIDAASALDARARATLGSSDDAICQMVASALDARGVAGGCLVDVGCGRGDLRRTLGSRFSRYVGLDAVRYEALPEDVEFRAVDLDAARWPAEDLRADVVAAVETVEHLENPWAFLRALGRIVRPGGWVAVTTPNQLSFLSLLALVAKRRFAAFDDAMYPMHRTALLPSDLVRAARAAGLEAIDVVYSGRGRVPLSGAHYPRAIAAVSPRLFSDNVLVIGRRP